jgi:DNA-binding PadR family transcriptional regulator
MDMFAQIQAVITSGQPFRTAQLTDMFPGNTGAIEREITHWRKRGLIVYERRARHTRYGMWRLTEKGRRIWLNTDKGQ